MLQYYILLFCNIYESINCNCKHNKFKVNSFNKFFYFFQNIKRILLKDIKLWVFLKNIKRI